MVNDDFNGENGNFNAEQQQTAHVLTFNTLCVLTNKFENITCKYHLNANIKRIVSLRMPVNNRITRKKMKKRNNELHPYSPPQARLFIFLYITI